MSDPFRKAYRPLTAAETAKVQRIKEKASELHALLQHERESEDARHLAIARTKLEECVMWATKGITGRT